MKQLIRILLVIAALGIFGCSGETDKEMFETAQLEELQKNEDHAKQLYRKLIETYPESTYATEARDRLDRLTHAKD